MLVYQRVFRMICWLRGIQTRWRFGPLGHWVIIKILRSSELSRAGRWGQKAGQLSLEANSHLAGSNGRGWNRAILMSSKKRRFLQHHHGTGKNPCRWGTHQVRRVAEGKVTVGGMIYIYIGIKFCFGDHLKQIPDHERRTSESEFAAITHKSFLCSLKLFLIRKIDQNWTIETNGVPLFWETPNLVKFKSWMIQRNAAQTYPMHS